MDPAAIGILGGITTVMMSFVLAIMFYLDRTRRAEFNRRLDKMDTRLDNLTDTITALAGVVGEPTGRMEPSVPDEPLAVPK